MEGSPVFVRYSSEALDYYIYRNNISNDKWKIEVVEGVEDTSGAAVEYKNITVINTINVPSEVALKERMLENAELVMKKDEEIKALKAVLEEKKKTLKVDLGEKNKTVKQD